MTFNKICCGASLGLSGGTGVVWGLSGEKCRVANYSGWFAEFAAGGALWSVGVDIGLQDGFLGTPTLPSGTNEAGISFGPGKIKISMCKYRIMGHSIDGVEQTIFVGGLPEFVPSPGVSQHGGAPAWTWSHPGWDFPPASPSQDDLDNPIDFGF
jgi:hypothetical protein